MNVKARRLIGWMVALVMAATLWCPALADVIEELPEAPVSEYTVDLGGDDAELPSDIPEETPTVTPVPEPDDEAMLESPPEVVAEETVSEAAEEAKIDSGNDLLLHHKLILGKGEKLAIYQAGSGGKPTFSSNNKNIAKVDASGNVTAVKVGTAIITATLDDVKETCEVTVKKAPTKITLNSKSVKLGYDTVKKVGDTFKMEYTLPSNSWTHHINVSGFSKKIVSVDGDGVVHALGTGKTTVTVSTFNKKKAKLTVTVVAMPKQLAFGKSSYTLAKGSTQALGLNFTGANVVYKTDNDKVVTVDATGKAKAVGPGKASVEATCFNGDKATCAVEVVNVPKSIKVSPASLELGIGETSQLSVTSDIGEITGGLTFKSNNSKYVSVSSTGLVKAVKYRSSTTNITVRTSNNLKATVKVKVLKAPSSITLDRTTAEMVVGDSLELKPTLTKNSFSRLTWTTSDPTVVDVDEDGKLTAIDYGSAVVTVSTANGKTAQCKVAVSTEAADIALPGSLSVRLNYSADLPLEVYGEHGEEYMGVAKIKFKPTGIVSYSNGRVRGLKEGTTVLTVVAGAKRKTCTITVSRNEGAGGAQSIAHRGGFGDTGTKENTLAAFARTASTGADGVEFDVHSTLDDVLVVHHDDTFTVKNMSYSIEEMFFDELRAVKPEIPTLDEVLDVVKPTNLSIHLELKYNKGKKNAKRFGKACVETIKAHGLADRTIYFSFYVEQLKDVYRADPTAVLGYSIREQDSPLDDWIVKALKDYHIKIAVCHKNTVTQAVTDALHNMGYEVCVWTPNTRSEVKAFCEMGVDYILSNYPSYCVEER